MLILGDIMNEKKQNPGLSTILSADVKDYNRLMSEDEKFASRTRTYYEGIMTIRIQEHGGRAINSPGNNLLAEFSSVAEALHCAWEIQQEMRVMNARSLKKRKMNFGIGINLGNVIDEEGRTYGEGVNIATGLDNLAAEGEICISGSVYDQVKDTLAFTYDYLGDQTLENIKEPVRAYRIPLVKKTAAKMIGNKNKKPKHRKKTAQRVNAVVIAAVIVVADGHFYFRDSQPPSQEGVSGEKTSSQVSAKPAIAVLPFANLTREAGHQHLGDGMTSGIIADLKKFKELSVITRKRIFVYKGKPARIKDVSRELGVQYVVEGSVRKAGDKVRVYAHLVDTRGRRLWTKRYEREVEELSAVQKDIVQTIAGVLEIKR